MLLLAIAIRYAFQLNIPRIVFTLIIILIALWGDRNEILALIICCIPLHESVDMFYSLVSCVLVYIFKFYRSLRINASILVFLLMIIWELLHCFGTSFSPVQFLSSIIPLIVLAILMCMDTTALNYPLIVRAPSYTTLSVAFTLLLNLLYISGFDFLSAVAKLQRLGSATEGSSVGSSLVGGLVNPNSLGILCVLSATGLMQIRNAKAGTKTDIILACAIIVFGALTASRTYLVCLAAMAVLLIFANGDTVWQKLRFMGLLVLLGGLAFASLAILFPDLLAYYISRFSEGDITTGRSDLMQQYHEYLMDNPAVLFLGIGLQDFGTRLIDVYRIANHVPHNSVQELVLAWGITGAALFAAMFFCMYHTSGRFRKRKILINSIPFLIILLKGMAGQMLSSAYTMLAFSYAYLSLCADLTPKDENRIFTRTRTATRGPGLNINQLRRKTNT